MIERRLLDDCRELVLTVAPELCDRPLYVVDMERFSDPIHSGCLGWALDGTRVCAFADEIPGWCGIGNLIALDGDAILQDSQPGQFERCVLNTALHEAGHLTPTLPPLPPEIANYNPPVEFRVRAMARLKADEPEAEPGTLHDAHDWKFARRCCHLYYRACAAGYDVPLYRLLGASTWQSPAEHYLPHLLAECIRMRDETFATIEATEPPAGLLELWQADLEYYKYQRERKRKCSTAS